AGGGDHLLDDARGAPQPEDHEREPEAAGGGGIRHQPAGRQQAAASVRRRPEDDEEPRRTRARRSGGSRWVAPVTPDRYRHVPLLCFAGFPGSSVSLREPGNPRRDVDERPRIWESWPREVS